MDVPTELPFSFITFAASAIISARARPVGGGGMGWGGIDIFPDVMDGLDSIRNSHRWPRTYVLLAGAPLKSDNLLGRRFTLN